MRPRLKRNTSWELPVGYAFVTSSATRHVPTHQAIIYSLSVLFYAAEDVGAVAFPDTIGRLAVGSIVVTLLAIVGPVLGAWVAIITAVGTLFAILIHAWYDRHPSDLPTPTEPQWRSPQINFSSTEVAGNIGGLIFVVGSVFIVAIGLPSVIWFLLCATIAGCFLAWALVTWHTSHPKRGLPENMIVLR
jgi:hypothetical protein